MGENNDLLLITLRLFENVLQRRLNFQLTKLMSNLGDALKRNRERIEKIREIERIKSRQAHQLVQIAAAGNLQRHQGPRKGRQLRENVFFKPAHHEARP